MLVGGMAQEVGWHGLARVPQGVSWSCTATGAAGDIWRFPWCNRSRSICPTGRSTAKLLGFICLICGPWKVFFLPWLHLLCFYFSVVVLVGSCHLDVWNLIVRSLWIFLKPHGSHWHVLKSPATIQVVWYLLPVDTSDLIQCGMAWDFLWEAFANQGLLMLEEEAKQRFQRRQVSWQEWCWNVESDVMLKSLKMKNIFKQNVKHVGKRVIADQLPKITCNRSPY